MDVLEFSAKVIDAVVWPVSLAAASLAIYWNRGRSGTFFGEFFKRLKEFNVGSFKVILAESSSPPALSTEMKSVLYNRYSNGIMVQKFWFSTIVVGKKLPLRFAVAFPNEVLSFQFIGSLPLPISDVTNTGFVLDASGCNGRIDIQLLITGL